MPTNPTSRNVGVLSSSKTSPDPPPAAAQQPAGLTVGLSSLKAPTCSLTQGPGAQQSSHGPGEPGTALEGAKPGSLNMSRLKTENSSQLPNYGSESEPDGRSPKRKPSPQWGCCVSGATTAADHFFSRKGLKSPQSNASMAWGLGRSLGFLKLSFSVRRVLSTSTGSVLPVNFCKGSSLRGDRLCCDHRGQDGDPPPHWDPSTHRDRQWGSHIPMPGGCWGTRGLTVGAPCWAVQDLMSRHPPLPRGLDFPPASEATGEGVMLDGKGEQSLGAGPTNQPPLGLGLTHGRALCTPKAPALLT